MARPLACRSPCQNPPPTGEDELAGAALGPVFIDCSDTSTPGPAVSRVPTSAPPDAPIAAPSPALALAATALSSNNELFKQFIKAYLEAEVPGRIEVDSEPRK